MSEFYKDFIAESKRVVWPKKKDLLFQTVNVISMSLIVAAIIFVMDFAFSQGMLLLQNLVK